MAGLIHFDPDDAYEDRWLREHDGAPALEPMHDEEEARELVKMLGYEILAVDAWATFDDRLYEMERNDEVPY